MSIELDNTQQKERRDPVAGAADAVARVELPVGRQKCHRCDGEARVHMLDGYAAGVPVWRDLCLQCAAAEAETPHVPYSTRRQPPLALLCGVAGAVLALLALLADYWAPEANMGFGLHQRVGVGLGIVAVFSGVLFRSDLVFLGGAFIFGASLLADVFGPVRSPGIGWKQQVVVWLAVGLILAGFAGRAVGAWRGARRTERRPAPVGDEPLLEPGGAA